MFNRKNFPSVVKPGAAVAGGGARAAGCAPGDYAQGYGGGNASSCSTKQGNPVLIGLDQDTYLQQNQTNGNFLPLLGQNGAQTTGYGPIVNLEVAPSTKITDVILAGRTVVGKNSAVFSFTSGCCWCAEGIYFSENFLQALIAAAPANAISRIVLLGVWAGNAGNDNLIGYSPMSTNQVPLEMLTDPRQNCCPLVEAPCVDKMAPYIAQIGFTLTAQLTTDVAIESAMFGTSSAT